MDVTIELAGVTRRYGDGPTAVRALDAVDLSVEAGTFNVVLGPSGSGKTTLLNVIGGMDVVDAGQVLIDGVHVDLLDRGALSAFRRDHIGFVFQFFNLVPTLTALENVALIADLTGPDADRRALDALGAVGLDQHGDRFPSQLSGGQQQRVAVARALAKDTPIVLCDEPTGALDRQSGAEVVQLLVQASAAGRTVVVVTHDRSIAARADRVIELVDGRIAPSTTA